MSRLLDTGGDILLVVLWSSHLALEIARGATHSIQQAIILYIVLYFL